jgi:hypothetical protein
MWDAGMRTLANRYLGEIAGKHARQWLNMVDNNTMYYKHIRAVDAGGPAEPFDALPTDFYASGPQFLSSRTAWDQNATWLFAQMGDTVASSGHGHHDVGSFQLWHGGRWLSKETTGYSNHIRSYSGGVTGSNAPEAHNTLMFNGVGLANAYPDAAPEVRRLESASDHVFIASDLSGMYRAHGGQLARDDNPYAKSVVRELLFVKPMHALVVFDRMESQSDVLPGDKGHPSVDPASVTKTFLLHTEAPPIVSGSTLIATSGDSVLKATTLLPAAPSIRIVNEGDITPVDRNFRYQYRTEIEQSGARQSYFLTVLHARSVNDSDIVSVLNEDDDGYTLTLTSPDGASAVVRFDKGMTSKGGSFGYSQSGAPTTAPLTDKIQTFQVTKDGPKWGAGLPFRPPVKRR